VHWAAVPYSHTPTYFGDCRLDTGDARGVGEIAIVIGHSPSCDSPLRSDSLNR
jgi:hypothetical protein